MHKLCSPRHCANTYEVQGCDRVALKRFTSSRWQPGTLWVFGGRATSGSQAASESPPERRPGRRRSSLAPIGRSRFPRNGKSTHEPAVLQAARPLLARPGTGRRRGPPRASFPSPLRRPRGGAVTPGRPDSSAALPARNPSPTGPPRSPPPTRAARSRTYRPGSSGAAAILEPHQHRAFSLAQAAQPIGYGHSGSEVAKATAWLAQDLLSPWLWLFFVCLLFPPFSRCLSSLTQRVWVFCLFFKALCSLPRLLEFKQELLWMPSSGNVFIHQSLFLPSLPRSFLLSFFLCIFECSLCSRPHEIRNPIPVPLFTRLAQCIGLDEGLGGMKWRKDQKTSPCEDNKNRQGDRDEYRTNSELRPFSEVMFRSKMEYMFLFSCSGYMRKYRAREITQSVKSIPSKWEDLRSFHPQNSYLKSQGSWPVRVTPALRRQTGRLLGLLVQPH